MDTLKKIAIGLVSVLICFSAHSQIPYSEDFNSGVGDWTINTSLGSEGSFPNEWYVSCNEEGVGAPSCGSTCSIGDQTLHVSTSTSLFGDTGASYYEGFTSTSHRRAESGDIITLGASSMTVSFDFIGYGNSTDYTEFVYSIDGGDSWVVLDPALTSLCCGGVPCDGFTQGLWQTASYLLPATCEGLGDFRIGFVWHNIDDLVATDPSFAVDNITITGTVTPTPPVAQFDIEDTTICIGSTITFNDESYSMGTITDWDWTFTAGTPPAATGAGPHDVTYNTIGAYTQTLEVTDAIGMGTHSITVTVVDLNDAGLDGAHDFCSSDSPADLFLDLTGADSPGVWDPTLTSGTGMFDPSVDAEGTILYIVSGACPNDTSEVVVSIETAAFAGTTTTYDFCSSDDSLDLTDVLGGDTVGVWTPALASGTNYFDPTVDGAGVYSFEVTGTPPCPNDVADLTISITTAAYAGEDTLHDFCVDGPTADLFLDLTGADGSGVWSPVLTSGTGVFNPSSDATGIYTYTVTGSGPCPDVSADVDVQIFSPPSAGSDGSHVFCSNDATDDLYDDLGFADVGGTWAPTLTSGTGVFDPTTDPPGDYVYTVEGSGGCPDSSATVTVTVVNFESAGTDSTTKVCRGNGSIDLFTVLAGSPTSGGTWNDDDASGGLSGSTFDYSPVSTGTYNFTYTITNTPPCVDDEAVATVDVVDCLGTEDNLIEVLVYPNPVRDLLSVEVSGATLLRIELMDLSGRVLQFSGNSTMKTTRLPAGVYLVNIRTDKGSLMKRLIKN